MGAFPHFGVDVGEFPHYLHLTAGDTRARPHPEMRGTPPVQRDQYTSPTTAEFPPGLTPHKAISGVEEQKIGRLIFKAECLEKLLIEIRDEVTVHADRLFGERDTASTKPEGLSATPGSVNKLEEALVRVEALAKALFIEVRRFEVA